MAEYYPLLERAVAGLQDATPGSRRAIYDRARNALLGQLRAMQPPIPEEDVQRESVALDDAIARLEERFSKDKPRAAPKPAATVRPVAAAPQSAQPPGLPLGTAPPVVPPPVRDAPGSTSRVAAPVAVAPVAAPRVSAGSRPRAPGAAPRAAGSAPRPPVPPRASGQAARPASGAPPDGNADPTAFRSAPPPIDTEARDGPPGPLSSVDTPVPDDTAAGANASDAPAFLSEAASAAAAPVLPIAPKTQDAVEPGLARRFVRPRHRGPGCRTKGHPGPNAETGPIGHATRGTATRHFGTEERRLLCRDLRRLAAGRQHRGRGMETARSARAGHRGQD